ncbi:MAG: BstXI family restriction endonuclease [Victivallales bacterium]|nr:BstXI family restriction endonuclease [Victivallales bacterium]
MTKITRPKLPKLLEVKIYKTGQTRGADNDVIYQNRVSRSSTVLIPYSVWHNHLIARNMEFENGYIVLIPPSITDLHELEREGLCLGNNSLYFYETRHDWDNYNPQHRHLLVATSRKAPLGGHFVARVPATNSTSDGSKINLGFTDSSLKGAGIRVYEYASSEQITQCSLQLEALFWHCYDAMDVIVASGMSRENAIKRRESVLQECRELQLLDYDRLRSARIVNADNVTICPLCLEPISGCGFMTRLSQVAGREVPDTTVTEVSLFHIEELRPGVFNHRPYNLGWGHHHCNVIAKDSGIMPTLIRLREIVERNINAGVDIPSTF